MIIRLMQTYHPSYVRRKERREKHMEKMARMREAKARKRMERAADEPPRAEWRGRHEFTFTVINRMTGAMHNLDLFRSIRRDQYDANVDGVPWKRGISATALAKYFRDKLKPHISR